jgi:hypothetical protein
MARVDDDSWDITESVGATALTMAVACARQARRDHPCSSSVTRNYSSMRKRKRLEPNVH